MPVVFVNETHPSGTLVSRIGYDITGWTEEDLKGGIVVDTIPEPKNNGKLSYLHINKETKEMWYEYEEMPKSEIEILTEENEALKKHQVDQDELLMQLMLGSGGN